MGEKYQPSGSHLKRNALIVLVLSILALCVCSVAGVSTYVSTYGQGVNYETTLTTDYKVNLGKLTTYYTDAQNTLHIADTNANALHKIIKDMVNGGYGTSQSAIGSANNQLYVQMQRAYPDLGSVGKAQRHLRGRLRQLHRL